MGSVEEILNKGSVPLNDELEGDYKPEVKEESYAGIPILSYFFEKKDNKHKRRKRAKKDRKSSPGDKRY